MWWSEKVRGDQLAEYALLHGYTFRREVPTNTTGDWWGMLVGASQAPTDGAAEVSLFNRGSSRRVRYEFRRGTEHGELIIFEYQFTTGSGKNRSTHTFSVAILDSRLAIPRVEIHPQTFLHVMGKGLGMQDIELESDEFNRAFVVKASEERFAFDFLTPEMMEWCLRQRFLSMEVVYGDFIIYQAGQLSLDFVGESERHLNGVLERIPGYVRQDFGGSN
ncbi:MAG: DUF3137 domain-containing protein [Armatimonadetes bacterium]|nr:DUF3137 domain-containing protein [Armatimonadota bacterium]